MAQAAIDLFGAESARIPTNWQRAHEELLKLATARAGLDFEEGRWLVLALESGVHVRLGYGSFAEYVERIFGYSPRFTREKLRVAEALDELPAMAEELRAGRTSLSAMRELTRVATPSTEREWLAAARGKTVREVERLVSGHRPGSRPDDDADSSAVRHVLRLEVSGEALAAFREAMAKVRRDAGEPLDDDASILLLSRHILGGPKDDGRSSYQVALTVCETCRRGKQHAHGELVDVSPELIEMSTCDGQHIGSAGGAANTHVGAETDSVRAKQDVPPAVRRAVLRRDEGRCRVPGCRHATFVDVHHVDPRSEGGSHAARNLITLCSAHHRAIHRGELAVSGTVSSGLRFHHADGSVYGTSPSPGAADVRSKAFRALRNLGFRETEVRRALEDAHVGAGTALPELIKNLVHVLTKARFRPWGERTTHAV